MMHAFTQGMMDGDFFRSLIRKSPRDYDHMLKKPSEYINVEEAQAARKKETPTELAAPPERRPQAIHQPPRGPRVEGMRPHQESRSHAVQHVEVEWPKSRGKGYHQVPLTRDDQEKVSFITADSTYCYNVMPFGLKNASVTYQRLMNKVFRKQIG
ncbi:uncharacterized protein LOC122013560 [Zingiber officinale]|uniref:uncharacterized protein LOC122013560 n=1 Tax=Zingiber officinale TaxID=94328 RepID=UPI001C4B968C|nr:uncharacterized protein LOC122013560 [Zingiber officinale]